MKQIAVKVVAVLLTCGLAGSPASAAELGGAAPALKIKEWIKGKSVDLRKGRGENIYVLEFWATWCAPCRASIPHLTELQKKYEDKGVVVVGISTEDPGKVKPFVKSRGDQMDYVVAIDDGGKTDRAYMDAFEIKCIPYAFVVDRNSSIVWHGNPLDGLDEALDKVAAGGRAHTSPPDAEKARAKAIEIERMLSEYVTMAGSAGRNSNAMKELGKKIVDCGGGQARLMDAFAWTILTHNRIKYRDLELAMAAARAAMTASEGKNASFIHTYARALFDSGHVFEAIRYQKRAAEVCRDPQMKARLELTLQEYERKTRER